MCTSDRLSAPSPEALICGNGRNECTLRVSSTAHLSRAINYFTSQWNRLSGIMEYSKAILLPGLTKLILEMRP